MILHRDTQPSGYNAKCRHFWTAYRVLCIMAQKPTNLDEYKATRAPFIEI